MFRFCFFIIVFFPASLWGQICKGIVSDSKGNPVVGASIYAQTAKIHTWSDEHGLFELHFPKTTTSDWLIISYIGYETTKTEITMEDLRQILPITLQETQIVLDEVNVFTNQSITKEFAVRQFEKLDIYLSPLSNADPLRAISILPFSTNTNESANIELRGSSKDFSTVFINGVPVYNPVRNTRIDGQGNFSILNAELLENENVYASNPPLKYGNTIAGAVEINTNSSVEQDEAKISLGLANMSGLLTKPMGKKHFVQFFSNYQFSDWYLGLNKGNADFLKSFSSVDAGVNCRSQISNDLSINLYAYLLKEAFISEYMMLNYRGSLDSDGLRNFNIMNVDFRLGKMISKLNMGASFAKTLFEFGNLNNKKNEKQYYVSFDNHIRLFSQCQIQWGLTEDYSFFSFDNTAPQSIAAIYPDNPTMTYQYDIDNHNVETYAYLKYYFWGNSSVGVGLRKNIPVKKQKNFVSWQSNVKLVLHRSHSLLFSTGMYHAYLSPDGVIYDFRRIRSTQVALDYVFSRHDIAFSFSNYYKKEKFPVYYYEVNKIKDTEINMWGLEASVEYRISNIHMSGSYIFLKSRSSFDSLEFTSSNSLKYLIRSSVGYVSKTLFNVAIGAVFHPGLFYTPIIGSEFQEDINNYIPHWGKMNGSKYPSYMTFDLSASKLFTIKNKRVVAFLSVTNLLNIDNKQTIIYSKDYLSAEYKSLMKRLFYFGATVSF